MAAALDGVRVLEVSTFGFVPAAGAVLADWGASVVKVEPTGSGDPMRHLTIGGIPPDTGGVTFMWEVFNRGKRSLAVDLRRDEGREIILRLVEESDVFLTSFRPSARRKLGIDVDDVVARNQRIVYARGSGQGPRGPEADKGGFDSISYWYRSGAGAAITPSDLPRPLTMPGPAFGDIQSGAMLAGGITAGLLKRERTGSGVVVDLSLMAAGMWAMQGGIAGTQLTGEPALRSVPGAGNPLSTTYRTADGRYIALAFTEPDRYWTEFCTIVGRPEWSDDPRFASAAARHEHAQECQQAIADVFATRSLAEWQAALATGAGQWDVVRTVGELHDDEQARANGYLIDVDHGSGRTLSLVAAPVQFDETPPVIGRAPGIGEHSVEVLHECGYDDGAIEQWIGEGVIAATHPPVEPG